jgi:hypothetical protein
MLTDEVTVIPIPPSREEPRNLALNKGKILGGRGRGLRDRVGFPSLPR